MIRKDITPKEARRMLRSAVLFWIAVSAVGVLLFGSWWYSVIFGVLSLAWAGAITYGRHKSLQHQREELA